MKKYFVVLALVSLAVAFSSAALATDTGPILIGYPSFQVGYMNPSFQFQTFEASPAPLLFAMTTTNLKTADRTNAVVGPTLNGTTTVTKTTVTSKNLAILNHISGFTLYPNTASSPFPSIWVKGADVNPSPDPTVYLTGTDANKFYQQGLTIQAPYFAEPDYQWTVYVFADKDLLTQTAGPVTGKVRDPRVSTMRWFAWADDMNGIAKPAFGYRNPADSSPTMFNTLPLIAATATEAQKKAFLIGTSGVSTPEVGAGYSAPVDGVVQASIPANGIIHYNIARNTPASDNANGFAVTGRSQLGMVYASPVGPTSHRTENLHIQFIAVWPNAPLGVAAGSKSCDLNLWQRTAL